MFGGGSIQEMQNSLKNNRNLLRKKGPFKRMKDYLNYSHINSHETKHLTKEEMAQLRIQLKKRKQHDTKVSILVLVAMLLVLAAILIFISGLAIF